MDYIKMTDFFGGVKFDPIVVYSYLMRNALDNLKAALDRSGMSQSELARRLGVTRSTVSNWISGKRTPQLGHLQEAARILNMTITEILGEEILFAETKTERDAIQLLREMSERDREQFLRLMRLAAIEETAAQNDHE